MKNILIIFLTLALVFCLCACGSTGNKNTAPAQTQASAEPTTPVAEVSVTSSEPVQEVVAESQSNEAQSPEALFGKDLIVVTDANFGEVLTEMIAHVGEYDGKVYQLEGTLYRDGENLYLGRTLKNGDELSVVMLPLRVVSTEIGNEAWVKVIGIVSTNDEVDPKETIFDVVSIEECAESGNDVVQWTGHHHE